MKKKKTGKMKTNGENIVRPTPRPGTPEYLDFLVGILGPGKGLIKELMKERKKW